MENNECLDQHVQFAEVEEVIQPPRNAAELLLNVQDTIDATKALAAQKKVKKVPNYMRPNATSLGKQLQSGSNVDLNLHMENMKSNRRMTMASKGPDLNRIGTIK